MATGQTIATASARDDVRFRDLGSVREHAIEAVLCTPIGRDAPVGVIYLRGNRAQWSEGFAADVVDDLELFARVVGLVAASFFRDREATEGEDAPSFPGVIVRSRVMSELVARLRLVAPLDVHVLLTGPSGAGKSLLARALHTQSARRAGPFVELNCAAIPEALLENELFGAEVGAHSAVPKAGVRGKVEAAHGGTLFLDEIAELSIPSQAKLLQLLQEKTYFRLGGTQVRRADTRIIAATNADLKAATLERRFREDLYYRLKVFEASVPPLADRAADVIPLARYALRTAARRHGLPERTLAPSAMRAIQSVEWPGNVRELANAVESGMLNAHLRRADLVEARDIFPDLPDTAGHPPASLQAATRGFQMRHVQATLEATDWNVTETARRLDIARSHLYTLIHGFDLRRSRE